MTYSVNAGTAVDTRPPAASQKVLGPGPREFLAFRLGQEEYGLDILRVQEIRSYTAPTQLPTAPSFILGVINLRGVIVPIVDMRRKVGIEQPLFNASTVVIVLTFGARIAGIVVDSVSDVLTLEPEHLHPVPELDASVLTDHLLAIGSLDNRTLLLLDIEALMRSPEMGLARAASAPALPSHAH
ncbi:chemotaxis protein CheW [Pseudorhodoferax sp. Leaf267]|uniref:chemotaxis protein CheW n=1 Tax=Pseudorhodoferax sp. Leaf267 TaxID=1736316 RepID=UPI0006F984C4|nr:chemotaxis protein CheW [Pseudorhodoferax sp. Leaf267]KQP13195.1 chemotaxis protein CheW [Pseudorhodoferax sp. Leaf267]